MPDQAYACSGCAYRAGDQLHNIVDTTPAARDIAHGFARRGTGSGGSGEPRLPLNLGATQRLDSVQASLTTWVRHVMAERGILGPGIAGDPLVAAARWLAGHVEWMRHRREVDEFLADVEACARVVSGIARGPGEQKFLGPCGATVAWDAAGAEVPRETPCDGDVYAHLGAKEGTCRACGARWATAKRQAWLDGEVREHAFEARSIAEAHRLNVKTIRTWANRGALRTYWRTDMDLVVEWTDPPIDDALKGEERAVREAEVAAELEARGPRLHYVGDVLDLAAADAARRATEQAKRARRAATRAAESEDAA
jgi:hypothetical protein